MVCAWRAIYDLVRPDLILFQHSPTAILASGYAHGIKGAEHRHGILLSTRPFAVAGLAALFGK